MRSRSLLDHPINQLVGLFSFKEETRLTIVHRLTAAAAGGSDNRTSACLALQTGVGHTLRIIGRVNGTMAFSHKGSDVPLHPVVLNDSLFLQALQLTLVLLLAETEDMEPGIGIFLPDGFRRLQILVNPLFTHDTEG